MGGGGSDNSYDLKQQQSENRKAAARTALNAAFGIAPTTAPSAGDFQQQQGKKSWYFSPLQGMVPGNLSQYNPAGEWFGDGPGGGTVADPTTYAGALSVYNQAKTDAEANKAAREALYGTVRDNAFTAGKRTFDERKSDATRKNKFALYAQGLQGGSVDIDENALLDRTYRQGLLDLGGKADATKADLRNNDEQARLQLLQSIDAGMDQSSALSSALGQLATNSDRATAAAQGTAIGDLFADSGALYTQSQAARGRQYALDNNPFASYARSRRNNAGASGVISNVGT